MTPPRRPGVPRAAIRGRTTTTGGDEQLVAPITVLPRGPPAIAAGGARATTPPTMRDHAASGRTSPGNGSAGRAGHVGRRPVLPRARSTVGEVGVLRRREGTGPTNQPTRPADRYPLHRRRANRWTKLRSIHGSPELEWSGARCEETKHDGSTPREPVFPGPTTEATCSQLLWTARSTRRGRGWAAPCSDTKLVQRHIRVKTKFLAHALRLSPTDYRDFFAVTVVTGEKGVLE